MEEKLKLLKEKLKLIRLYDHALGILNFDFETIVPSMSREDEADVLNYFGNEMFKLTTADDFKALVEDLHGMVGQMQPYDRLLVENLYDELKKVKHISPELDMERSEILSRSYNTWLSAKEHKDYNEFAPVFKEVIDINRKCVDLREDKLPDYYDNLLNDYEKDVLQADLDPFFAELKEGLVALLNRIKGSTHTIRRDFLTRAVPIHKQDQFSRYLLTLNGYEFRRGALATTEHPFTSNVARHDARVTTHYYENLFVSNIFSIIHEGGHAIFMQCQPAVDYDYFINDSISNGMHESVSRFYENIIGRSKAYIHLIYPEFHRLFAEELGDVSEEELYEAVNIVEPSLIRTEADEVTYGLHIIIRYEMEKMLAAGTLRVEDAAAKWNELYREYLGIKVPDDAQGILQDVHWTWGFGYFPSYALGNCYNAMYFRRMRAEMDVDALVRAGDMGAIKDWLTANVFAHANTLKPKEWLRELTGQSLSPTAFLDYLNAKYTDLYRLV